MTRKLIILGTGGNCLDLLDMIDEINRAAGESVYECAGFLDDDASLAGKDIGGVKVLGPLATAREHGDCFFVNGIGSPRSFWRKRDIIATTRVPPERFETVVHPFASVSPTARLGPGCVVFQNVVVATRARLGRHVIVLPNSVISHDAQIGDYTCIAGGVCVSGGAAVGDSCYLGANAAVRGDVRIGRACLVGMGSVVLKNVEDNRVVVGNPARVLRKTTDETLTPGSDLP